MKARQIEEADQKDGIESGEQLVFGPWDTCRESDAAIDDATEAADEMAAKSAVLVEMMEDLEERLRRRMVNISDPAKIYSRKVSRLRSLSRSADRAETIETVLNQGLSDSEMRDQAVDRQRG